MNDDCLKSRPYDEHREALDGIYIVEAMRYVYSNSRALRAVYGYTLVRQFMRGRFA